MQNKDVLTVIVSVAITGGISAIGTTAALNASIKNIETNLHRIENNQIAFDNRIRQTEITLARIK